MKVGANIKLLKHIFAFHVFLSFSQKFLQRSLDCILSTSFKLGHAYYQVIHRSPTLPTPLYFRVFLALADAARCGLGRTPPGDKK